jgi:hypothetical protein
MLIQKKHPKQGIKKSNYSSNMNHFSYNTGRFLATKTWRSVVQNFKRSQKNAPF